MSSEPPSARGGFVDCIHDASHAKDRDSTEGDVARKNLAVWRIEDYPNWLANGHGEVYCSCEDPVLATEKVLDVGRGGRALMAIAGDCEHCGYVYISPGKLYRDRYTHSFAIVHDAPSTWRAEDIDLAFGNPLTYHDPLAAAYGNGHRGLIEGVHGVLSRRWRLTFEKRPLHSHLALRIQTAITFGAMHVLADYHDDQHTDSRER